MTSTHDTRPGRRAGRPEPADVEERRRTARLLLVLSAAVVVTRLVYAWQPLRSDEGGYLLLARWWSPGAGEFLYGDHHVDRPPLLLAIFRLAALTEWDRAIRLLAIPFVVAAVLLTARAAYLAAGWTAARWSAVVATALVSSPALAADQADGGLFAVPLVAGAVALGLEAWRRESDGARFRWAVAAGALGAAAALVKQNYLEGLLFAAALVVADAVARPRVRGWAFAAGIAVGAVLPHVLVAAWADRHGLDPLRVWTDVVAFRGEALQTIWDGSMRAPALRGATLVALALVSALVPLAWTWFRWLTPRVRAGEGTPEQVAVGVVLVYGVSAMVVGGSYWPHYLLQLAVGLGLAAGIVASQAGRHAVSMRRWSGVTAGSAVVGFVGVAAVYALVPQVWFQERVGQWLEASAAPGDTAVVTYGHPVVLETADVETPYPYLWSLPMRTLDTDQRRLRAVLAGPEAPTWVVRMNAFDSWGIDDGGRLRALVEERYDVVARVCGRTMWLRADLDRPVAPAPDC